MRKDNRTVKAVVVILVVGIGLFHNLNKHSFLSEQLKFVTVRMDNYSENTDSLEVKENKLFIYTKKIIDSGIQHLISRL